MKEDRLASQGRSRSFNNHVHGSPWQNNMLLRRIVHSWLTGIALLITLQALRFLHLLIFLHQYTARTEPRAKAVAACIAIDTILVAHTAASGTLQKRLKTAACESATTNALDKKGLGMMLFKIWI